MEKKLQYIKELISQQEQIVETYYQQILVLVNNNDVLTNANMNLEEEKQVLVKKLDSLKSELQDAENTIGVLNCNTNNLLKIVNEQKSGLTRAIEDFEERTRQHNDAIKKLIKQKFIS